MGDVSGSRVPEVELAGIGPGVGHELLHRVRRECGMHHQDHVAVRHARDRREVLDRIVAGILRHRGNHRQRAGVAVEQRVAVGLGGGERPRPDRAAGAGAVVDDHALSHRALDLLREEACQHVGLAAGRRGHDHLDQPLRIGALRRRDRGGDRRRSEGGQHGQKDTPGDHSLPRWSSRRRRRCSLDDADRTLHGTHAGSRASCASRIARLDQPRSLVDPVRSRRKQTCDAQGRGPWMTRLRHGPDSRCRQRQPVSLPYQCGVLSRYDCALLTWDRTVRPAAISSRCSAALP